MSRKIDVDLERDEEQARKRRSSKAVDPADPAAAAELEQKYHGYSPEQIALIEASRDPAPAVPSEASMAVQMPEPEPEPEARHD